MVVVLAGAVDVDIIKVCAAVVDSPFSTSSDSLVVGKTLSETLGVVGSPSPPLSWVILAAVALPRIPSSISVVKSTPSGSSCAKYDSGRINRIVNRNSGFQSSPDISYFGGKIHERSSLLNKLSLTIKTAARIRLLFYLYVCDQRIVT